MNELPRLGFGTWQIDDRKTCIEAVKTALETGYRHIDTAQIYRNEEHVGEGISRSDVDRDEVFLATKLWINNLSPERARSSARESLERLQTDYVDLLYIHWPAGDYDPENTLSALQELRDEGVTRLIGLSNFTEDLLEEAQAILGDDLFANQVEMHPLLPQEAMTRYTRRNGIKLVAYSPIARGRVFDVDEIQEVADRHGVSEAVVSIAWLMEKDVYPIPKSETPAHIEENYDALRIELDREDIDLIDEVNERKRLVEPEFHPDW